MRSTERGADVWLDAALMAAARALAHELLDTLALHLEAAQAACISLEQELLLAAIAARETVLGRRVWFEVDGRRLGCGAPAPIEVVLQPPGATDDPHAPLRVIAEVTQRGDAVHASDGVANQVQTWRGKAIIASPLNAAPPADESRLGETFVWSPEQVRENPFACAAEIGRVFAQAIETSALAIQYQVARDE